MTSFDDEATKSKWFREFLDWFWSVPGVIEASLPCDSSHTSAGPVEILAPSKLRRGDQYRPV